MLKKISLTFCFLPLLIACQSITVAPQTNLTDYLADELFPGHINSQLESAEMIFAMSPEMKAFVDNHVAVKDNSRDKIKALADGLFDDSNLSILYQNDANTIASETFTNGMANCLSLTIMAFALADYADLGVNFQQVDVPELWVLRDGASMLNRHINLKLFKKRSNSVVTKNGKSVLVWDIGRNYTVDFNQRATGRYLPRKIISKERVLSMFYNNKGVEKLLADDHDVAYAYFKKALYVDPTLMDTYTNLGVMYRRLGYNDKAEKNYDYALTLVPNDYTVLENLAALYRVTDREDLAQEITQTLAKKRRSNPYYHYLLGQRALEQHKPAEAKGHLQKAIHLLEGNHEFYYAMARTLYLLGEQEPSKYYMKLAKRYSDTKREELRYQYKLDSYSQVVNNQPRD